MTGLGSDHHVEHFHHGVLLRFGELADAVNLLLKGLTKADLERLLAARCENGPFQDPQDLQARAKTSTKAMELLARAGGIVMKLLPTTPIIAKAGDQLTYAAQVGGSLDKTMTWSATAGSIVDGIYSVPSGLDYTAQTITVTANADPTKKLMAQVSVLPPAGQFEISGPWKDGYGYGAQLYQSGTSIQGTYTYGSYNFVINGIVTGYTFSGTATSGTSTYAIPGMGISPDGKTISGSITGWGNVIWTKQAGIVMKLSPTAPIIAKAGDQLTYAAQVGGRGVVV